MKKALTLAFIILMHISLHAQGNIRLYSIKITPVGPSDKPIDALTLRMTGSDSILVEAFDVVLVTDAKTMQTSISFVKNHDTNDKIPGDDYGSFSVSIFKANKLVTNYFLASHIESKKYLQELLKTLSGEHLDTRVILEVQRILTRVNY